MILRFSQVAIFSVCILILFSCDVQNEKTVEHSSEPIKKEPVLFHKLSPDSSGVDFANIIDQTFELSIYTYEYLYNGGGVAIGDINNDGLNDIYFTASVGQDQVYLNLGNLKFQNITKDSGIENQAGVKTGVTMADVNADGYLDIYVCRSGHNDDPKAINNYLYINNGDNSFTESAAEFGLDDQANTTQSYFFDYDQDGDLDLYLVNHRTDFTSATRLRLRQQENGEIERILEPSTPFESDRLYRNDGASGFTDVTNEAGISNSAFGLSASIMDFNSDGYLDVFVANDYVDPDYCYINNGDGTFTDKMEDYFRHISQSSMGSDVADFNNDGYLDMFVADMASESNYRQKSLMNPMVYDRYATLVNYGFGKQLGRNVVQVNNSNGTFSEVGEITGMSRTDWSWAPFFADFDNDGLKDVFVANGYRFEVTNNDYLNFTLDSLNKNVGLSSPEKLSIFLENIPYGKLNNYAFKNLGDLNFKNSTIDWGLGEPTFSAGAAYADLDNDGDLELIINEIDEFAKVYENKANEKTQNNYLSVKLKGPENNKFGIGSRVSIYSQELQQTQELFLSRGFQSSVSPVLYFGLGLEKRVDSLRVNWADGSSQLMTNVNSNQLIEIDYTNSVRRDIPFSTNQITQTLASIEAPGVDYKHVEGEFIDFKREPLIPHMLSCEGPILLGGDVNGDGLDDLFIGGGGTTPGQDGNGQAASLYLQTNTGDFTRTNLKSFQDDRDFEDVGGLFFDADKDGDLDLYVVSGSNEYPVGSPLYQDRLYINDGKGSFSRSESALPSEVKSGRNVSAADYDKDGDLDLFIGTTLLPGNYPKAPRSILLQNENGNFTDVTNQVMPKELKPSMVTDATWADLDKNGYPDLVLVGEWMPITILYNDAGKLEYSALENTEGWWQCVDVIDHGGDGNLDLVAGNLGLNSRLRASVDEPVGIYYSDFDNNGSLDAVMSYYNGGKEHPLPQKDLLLKQLPSLKKKFVRSHPYAIAGIEDLYSADVLKKAGQKKAYTMESSLIMNTGNGDFSIVALPREAQVAPIKDFLIYDYNGDGKEEILAIGNSFQTEVETGLYDAFNGLVLENDGDQLKGINHTESGFFAPGDGRSIVRLNSVNGSEIIICAFNNDGLKAFRKSNQLDL